MEMKLLRWALFAAFLVCLYVSIPHLAWTFHSWQSGGIETPFVVTTLNVVLLSTTTEWFNAYLEACAIDIIIALISYTLTNSKQYTQKGIGYFFVSLLIAISWLFNWFYAIEHAPAKTGVWADTIHVLWWNIHVSTITPIITSALPLFALAFTFMIDKLTGERLDVKALETQLQERKAVADLRKQYAISAGFSLSSLMKKGIDEAIDITRYATEKVKGGALIDGETDLSSDGSVDRESINSSVESERKHSTDDTDTEEESHQTCGRKARGKGADAWEEMHEENLPSWLLTGETTIPLQTVAREMKISLLKLKNRVESKQIRATKGKRNVYKDSLIAWMKAEGILEETPKNAILSSTGNAEESTASGQRNPARNEQETEPIDTKELVDSFPEILD